MQNHWLSAAESGKPAIMGKLFSIKWVKNKEIYLIYSCLMLWIFLVSLLFHYSKAHTQFQIRQIKSAANDASNSLSCHFSLIFQPWVKRTRHSGRRQIRMEASLTTGEIRQSVKHTIGELCLFLTASWARTGVSAIIGLYFTKHRQADDGTQKKKKISRSWILRLNCLVGV